MSINVSHTNGSAVRYNATAKYRLKLTTPENLKILRDIGVNHFGTNDADIAAIKREQARLGLTADGKIGPTTLAYLLRASAPVTERYWADGVNRLPQTLDYDLTAYDEAKGLDLHRAGWFTPKWFQSRPAPTQIVVHWGGLNPEHLYSVFSGVRKVSSHVAIGRSNNESVKVFQMLNLEHKAWHAGTANGRSIGIDICQQASMRWSGYYAKNNYDVAEIQNPAEKGPKRCLSLDPDILKTTALVLRDLCAIKNIPLRSPDKNTTLRSSVRYRGVLGHHHISRGKWDCAPWWDMICEEAGIQRTTESYLD